ncbi:unnamed protein product [Tetraodon nigroviridis]|uniref:(spotted green pufferfish) hypothetical protein n=1 Tax=Tetraodon nigroviridis TaxID=99883 RepID=Q4RVZ1_TETNG|nr:unnamed protein product [Tetraodon nigroviridis]
MASVPVYCLCRLPYDVTRFMIECDICQDWFHGSCVEVEEDKAAEIDLYHCPNCQVTHGPSVMRKRRGGNKQPDYGASGTRVPTRPVKTGSSQFVRELRSRTFPNADEVLLKPTGAQLTVEFLEEHSFSVPVMVLRRDGLGMTLPPSSFCVTDVEHHIGSDREIDVIDVSRQCDLKMRLGDFVEYYNSPNRDKVLNVISLEFSETRSRTGHPVQSTLQLLQPLRENCAEEGEKIFYLISPTPANLALFERWSSSSSQNEMFFGDQVDMCYRCSVKQGNTLFIPTGWIHAVLTPVDCLAFGGNFLHSLNIDMQLRAYEIEKRLSTADLFKFPNFETVCWYVGKHLLDTFRGLRENRRHPAAYLVHGAKALNNAFRSWTRKEALGEHEVEIPETINTQTLVKDLAKEIRLVEVGKKKGPKPKEVVGSLAPAGAKKQSQRGLLKAEAGELDLLEIHTKHTLKKFNPGKSKGRSKVSCDTGGIDVCFSYFWVEYFSLSCPVSSTFQLDMPLDELGGKLNKSKLKLVLTNGKIQGKKNGSSNGAGSAGNYKHISMEGSSLSDLDSEDELQIDETPPPRRKTAGKKKKLSTLPRKLPRAKPCSDPNRIREPGEVDFDIEEDYTTDEEALAAHGVKGGAGGILDLLKASKQVAGLDSAAISQGDANPPQTGSTSERRSQSRICRNRSRSSCCQTGTAVLNFTALLIEYSFSRHLYSSIEHLTTLLASCDMQVVLSVLNLLYVFSKRSNYITRLGSDKRTPLLARLQHLAESWGGKENGFGLAECCRDLPMTKYPPSATTLHFEFYAEPGPEVKLERKTSSNTLHYIHIEQLDKVIKFLGDEQDQITFVTRAVRVVDLITNLDMAAFQSHSGLSIFICRLEHEVDLSRKECPFVIKPKIQRPNAAVESEDMDTDMEVSEVAMESSPGPSTSSGCRSESDHRIQSCSPNTPRAVMDGSLPTSLKHIISNAEYYGPSLFLLATEVVTVFVFQEPSLLSSLQDNGLTDVMLHALLIKDLLEEICNLGRAPEYICQKPSIQKADGTVVVPPARSSHAAEEASSEDEEEEEALHTFSQQQGEAESTRHLPPGCEFGQADMQKLVPKEEKPSSSTPAPAGFGAKRTGNINI